MCAVSFVVETVNADPGISRGANFPRFISDAEKVTPIREKNIRYTLISTDQEKRGREINWTKVLRNGPYDVVIISDSFLGGTPHGKNLCRDIAAKENVSVLHIFTNFFTYSDENPFRLLVFLTNNGFLQNAEARVVILESAERTLPGKITASGPVTDSEPLPGVPAKNNRTPARIKSLTLTRSPIDRIDNPLQCVDTFVNKSISDAVTLKTWAKNDLLSVMGDQSNDGTFYFEQINESRFSNALYHSRLIFFKGDIEAFHQPGSVYPDQYIGMNENLNLLSGRLRDQNISLIFIPAVSTYNSYYPYIIDPPTVRNPLFEVLRELDHSYVLVDTKAVVMRLQQNGEKDLSGIGDPAHWTGKVSDAIADEIDLDAEPAMPSNRDTVAEYDRAVRAFRSVIYERGDPVDPWAWKMDGQIYEKQGDYLNATRCYQRSLDQDPRQQDLRTRIENLRQKRAAG